MQLQVVFIPKSTQRCMKQTQGTQQSISTAGAAPPRNSAVEDWPGFENKAAASVGVMQGNGGTICMKGDWKVLGRERICKVEAEKTSCVSGIQSGNECIKMRCYTGKCSIRNRLDLHEWVGTFMRPSGFADVSKKAELQITGSARGRPLWAPIS
jgi:hypothetical protein